MKLKIGLTMGRSRMTSAVSPSEAGYISDMNRQMKELQDRFKDVVRNIENANPEALRYAAQPIFDESRKLVPKDTWKLHDSGFMEVRANRQGASLNIGYGRGGIPAYAPIVHERLDTRHADGTQAKFLEEAVKRKLHLFPRRYKRFMQQATGLRD